MNIKTIIMIAAILPVGACSSAAAAKKTGVDMAKVETCETLVCIQTQNSAEQVDEKVLPNGLTQHVFRMQKRQGSYLRSLGYGVAAVGTLGLSEVITTPAEGAIQNDKQFAVIADCDSSGNCPRLVLIENNQEPYIVRGHTAEERSAIEAAAAEKAATN